MTKTTILFGIIAFGAMGLAGCANVTDTSQKPTSEKKDIVQEIQTTGTEQEPEKIIIAENGQAPIFTDFTQERYSEHLGEKPFAIFFHAGWCPACIELEKQINENIGSLPQGTVILKADYDTENKLRQEYGITTQATVVVIDKSGNAMPTLFGPTFEELKAAITQSL